MRQKTPNPLTNFGTKQIAFSCQRQTKLYMRHHVSCLMYNKVPKRCKILQCFTMANTITVRIVTTRDKIIFVPLAFFSLYNA